MGAEGGRKMNIAAIKRECVSRRKAVILDVLSDGQWISDGVAAWPVEGLRLSVGGLESLFNLSEKQLDKLQILEREVADVDYRRYRLSDDEDTDIVGMLIFSGETFVAVRSHRGLLWIPHSAIRHIKEDYMAFAVRWMYGRPLVAVYDGFTVGALVTPMSEAWAELLSKNAAALAAPRFVWPDEADGAEEAAEEMAGKLGLVGDLDEESEEGRVTG